MLAPLFEPFLDELRSARAGEPTVVHLLSNGMAMTEARFRRCLERGVTSFSFSLDGMSASTNDVLRIGSRADLLVERIAALAAARPPHARMGISFVVTRANLGELDALVAFAARARLDWLKLEEMFAATDVARDLVVERYTLDVAVANARAKGEGLGVPVLDHTRDLDVWKCRVDMDRRMATRALLDDLVNRADLNPCRTPWETVCVEPNGDVRPLSFHHPVEGNLLEDDLGALFRRGAFVDARRAVRAHRLCGAGPAMCAADPGPSSW
jgi:MoaA/NifB/PqqE/SkfB family radical SAM enzyme